MTGLTMLGATDAVACDGDACALPGAASVVTDPAVDTTTEATAEAVTAAGPAEGR